MAYMQLGRFFNLQELNMDIDSAIDTFMLIVN